MVGDCFAFVCVCVCVSTWRRQRHVTVIALYYNARCADSVDFRHHRHHRRHHIIIIITINGRPRKEEKVGKVERKLGLRAHTHRRTPARRAGRESSVFRFLFYRRVVHFQFFLQRCRDCLIAAFQMNSRSNGGLPKAHSLTCNSPDKKKF